MAPSKLNQSIRTMEWGSNYLIDRKDWRVRVKVLKSINLQVKSPFKNHFLISHRGQFKQKIRSNKNISRWIIEAFDLILWSVQLAGATFAVVLTGTVAMPQTTNLYLPSEGVHEHPLLLIEFTLSILPGITLNRLINHKLLDGASSHLRVATTTTRSARQSRAALYVRRQFFIASSS